MTDTTVWVPPVPTGREGLLVEDFPTWLRQALMRWFKGQLMAPRDVFFNPDLVLAFQVATRRDYGFTATKIHFENRMVPWLLGVDDDTYLQFVHFLLWSKSQYGGNEAGVTTVEQVLSNAGSMWSATRVNRRSVLIRRVSTGVLNSVSEALSGTDAAAQKLQEAWLDAFGTNPRASVAYYNSVVAVENAAFAVIPVGTPEPTLANLFSLLEADTPKWKLTLRDNDRAPGGKALAQMLRTLWRGHDSRHGASEYEDVTIEQARAAVMLAATLVWWLRSGVVVPTKATTE